VHGLVCSFTRFVIFSNFLKISQSRPSVLISSPLDGRHRPTMSLRCSAPRPCLCTRRLRRPPSSSQIRSSTTADTKLDARDASNVRLRPSGCSDRNRKSRLPRQICTSSLSVSQRRPWGSRTLRIVDRATFRLVVLIQAETMNAATPIGFAFDSSLAGATIV